MVQFSEKQQEKIKEGRKRKERREMLLAASSKIMNGIERNSNRSGERAIWELMQNARDLSDHAITKIKLASDSIIFAHKGEPFNLDTLSNLVKQQSTKKGDDNTAGQYGTGFMTTHIFSRKIYINGDCRIECGDTCMYVPLPKDFCLNRSSNVIDEFISEMDSELSTVETLIGASGDATPREWTTFRYPLSSDKIEKISRNIKISSKLIPYVLAFNDRIEECFIDNLGECIFFRKECRNIIPIDSESYKKVETRICVRNGDLEDIISVYSLESNDHQDRIIIPPLPVGFDDTTVIPSQFIFFPMLGTEKWGTNFIFHSSRLFPIEERNSFFFPKEDDNVKEKYIHNEEVLKKMIDMLFSYYRNNSEEQHLPIDFAKVDFDYKGDDNVTKVFYENLQRRFADEFIEWKMIPTNKGYKSIKNDNRCRVLDEEIYRYVDEKKMEDYIPSIVKYIPSDFVVPSKDIIEWSKIVKKWAPITTEYYLTMEEICHNVVAEDVDLHTLLQFIKDLDTNGTELLERCALIPNREGRLMKIGDLRNGENITEALYEIAKPILGEAKDKLINTKYAGLFASSLSLYTRSDLRNEIKSVIDNYQNQSLKHKFGNGREPILLDEEVIKDLIKYCSAFDTSSPVDYRARLLETICDIYNVPFIPIFIPQIEDDKPDLYSTSFKFLVEHTMFMLSQQSIEWLRSRNNREILYQFVEKCLDTEDEEKLEDLRNWLNKYGIIPNQLDELCKLDDLRVNKSICEDLQELYKSVFDIDLKRYFVSSAFAGLSQLQLPEYFPQEVGDKVEKHFEEELNGSCLHSKEILVILNHLDSGWKDYFRDISRRRAELYYKFGSDEDRNALFQIQMQGSDKLQGMADLIKSEHFDDILIRAKLLAEQAQEKERQFMFTYTIGKLLEDSIRNEINSELTCIYEKDKDLLSAEDVQCGQDIVIKYRDKPLFYLECKAKWNFTEPAHMSSLQMKQAVEKAGQYALCCIDCTYTTGCGISSDATKDEILKASTDILKHTYVHRNLNEVFGDILKPIIGHEKEPTEEDKIRIKGDFSCDISKTVFTNGQPFNAFIIDMIQYLRDTISN